MSEVMKSSDKNKDDAFEHLNPDDDALGWLKKYYSDVRRSSSGKQIFIGAVSGWSAGFVFGKFGKTAATAIGGTLILLHFAHYHGYVKIDWNRLNRDVKIAKREIEKRKDNEIPLLMEKVKQFIRENMILAGGFTGGFLLGMASA